MSRKQWKNLESLCGEPEGAILFVQRKYTLRLWHKNILVVVVGNAHYFAGPSLQEQEHKLRKGCFIRLGKERKQR